MQFFTPHTPAFSITVGIIAFLLLLTSKILIIRSIQRSKKLSLESKQKWAAYTKTITFLLIIITCSAIWIDQLRTFAISIVAIAAAVAIATKELILNICGTFLHTFSRPFSIGDRIEIDKIRGDVIDQDLLTTTIMEVGPNNLTHQYTGRSVTIPNAVFLHKNITNETFFQNFVLHTFILPISKDENIELHEKILLSACEKECNQYLEIAQKEMNKITGKKNLPTISLAPRITFKIIDPSVIDLIARVTVPARQRGKIENAIIKNYLQRHSTCYTHRQIETSSPVPIL